MELGSGLGDLVFALSRGTSVGFGKNNQVGLGDDDSHANPNGDADWSIPETNLLRKS